MSEVDQEYSEFLTVFGTEQACISALFNARWPSGFRCPSCGFGHYYLICTRRLPLYECASCRLQTSITAGTVMEGSRTPLIRWFRAIFLLSRPDGISALRLSELISVTYKTAWLIAHKIRHAMSAADASVLLNGNVRLDHGHYGDSIYDDARQPLLIGASLDEDGEPDYIKIKQPQPSHVSLQTRNVLPEGFRNFYEQHTALLEPIHVRIYGKMHPALLQTVRELCAWLNNTFNGIGAKHLQNYLNEYTFRINRLNSGAPIFANAIAWCARTMVITYPRLTAFRPVLQHPWLRFGSKAIWRGSHMSRWGG